MSWSDRPSHFLHKKNQLIDFDVIWTHEPPFIQYELHSRTTYRRPLTDLGIGIKNCDIQ